MNGKDLLDRMSEVDPKLIEDADRITENAADNKPKNKRALIIGITSGMATIAAALAIIAAVNGNFIRHKPPVDNNVSAAGMVDGLESTPANGVQGAATSKDNNASVDLGVDDNGVSTTGILQQAPESIDIIPEAVVNEDFSEYEDLPKVTNKEYGVSGGANMLETYGVYSVYKGEPKELESHSPWSMNAKLTTLPVFLSNSTEPDTDKMAERVKFAAEFLEIPEGTLKIRVEGADAVVGGLDGYREYMEKDGIPQDEIDREIDRLTRTVNAMISVEGESTRFQGTIRQHTDGELTIWFKEPYIELPDGCRVDGEASADEQLAAVEYLAEKYKELLGYENPQVARYSGINEYNYSVYDAAGDLETQILNYWMKNTDFLGSFEYPGKMDMLRMQTMENLEKLGDYPIYTAQQALWVMSSDRVPEEVRIPKNAEVVKVDLEYSNSIGYTAVIPYYEFTVKTDEISDFTGEKMYAHYSIPAVPEQFLDMDIADYGVYA